MLDELTGYSSFGTVRLLSRMIRRIGESDYTAKDLQTILAADVVSPEMAKYDAALALLLSLELCSASDDGGVLTLSEAVCSSKDEHNKLSCISATLIFALESHGVFASDRLEFDSDSGQFYLPLQRFPIKMAPFRNLLVELGALERHGKRLYLTDETLDVVRSSAVPGANGMTPDELYQKMERDRVAGEMAEQFVMEFEARRLGDAKAASIVQVSSVSVSAGYDIASFNGPESPFHDRLIEVKAIGRNGFFFSATELAVAREKGAQYYIYLVDLKRIGDEHYEPIVIVDPANYFSSCGDWRVVASSYHITPIP